MVEVEEELADLLEMLEVEVEDVTCVFFCVVIHIPRHPLSPTNFFFIVCNRMHV